MLLSPGKNRKMARGTAARPRIPFPYFAEVMTGFEYSPAALMMYSGMVNQGIECVYNIRARYDGEKRNPWNETECGHHYARAMASWSSALALSGFQYDGHKQSLVAVPRVPHKDFTCFWSSGTGWGTFSYRPSAGKGTNFTMRVLAGTLPCRSLEVSGTGGTSSVVSNGKKYLHSTDRGTERTIFHLDQPLILTEGTNLVLELRA